MQTFTKIMPLQSLLSQKKELNLSIGLVPTMGALHQGHLSLIKKSIELCDVTVASIFVNPTQFNKKEDFDKYPITLEADKAMLLKEGVDILFAPEINEMYPSESKISMNFKGLDNVLEGAFRPGHFSGVGLVISKLFNIVKPDLAFFGQKDLQQVAIIKQLNQELTFGIDIRTIQTERNLDGLALSSRNKRLSSAQRELAPILYKTLSEAKEAILNGSAIEKTMHTSRLQLRKLEPDINLEYLELVDSNTLKVVEELSNHHEMSLCIAAYLGDVRLIDNLFLISQ